MEGGRPPEGVTWLRVFCGLQVAFYGILALLGSGVMIALIVDPPYVNPGEPPAWIVGAGLLVLAVPMLLLYLVGLLAPRKPWVYGYGVVITITAFMCGGCWFMAIPFLIYWIKPETKAWYESA